MLVLCILLAKQWPIHKLFARATLSPIAPVLRHASIYAKFPKFQAVMYCSLDCWFIIPPLCHKFMAFVLIRLSFIIGTLSFISSHFHRCQCFFLTGLFGPKARSFLKVPRSTAKHSFFSACLAGLQNWLLSSYRAALCNLLVAVDTSLVLLFCSYNFPLECALYCNWMEACQ